MDEAGDVMAVATRAKDNTHGKIPQRQTSSDYSRGFFTSDIDKQNYGM